MKDGEGISVHINESGCSCNGYVDISDNSAFLLKINIPKSAHYKITVCHKASSHKENVLMINNESVMRIISENGDWKKDTVDGIFIKEGNGSITLGEGWSWFSIDYILIEEGSTISDSIYTPKDTELSNPNANEKTKNIYKYLLSIYGKKTLAGQCTNYGTTIELDALYKGLGKYPALATFDFIGNSYAAWRDKGSMTDRGDIPIAIKWSIEGGIVGYDWHWYSPMDSWSFYSKENPFQLSKAVTDLDLSEKSLEEIESLWKEKEINEEAYWIIFDMDNISGLLKELQDAGVSVLWHPLHEASGKWFWWGGSGAEAYKWLWKLMYKRMTNYHQLNNLIWVWNAQDAEWYPGDEYCDIASLDIYLQAKDYGISTSSFKNLSDNIKNAKMLSISECATMPNPDLIERDNVYWLYFAVWNWDYIVKRDPNNPDNIIPELSDAYTSIDMMKNVYYSDLIITRDELPKFD